MIDAYTFGCIVINGKKYFSDVIIFGDTVDDSWWRKEGHSLSVEDIKGIVEKKPDVIIVGTGSAGVLKITPGVENYVESKGIELIAKKTSEACKIYNELSKKKNVAAALHLTC